MDFGGGCRDGEKGRFIRHLGGKLTGIFIRALRMFHFTVPSSKTGVIQLQPMGQILPIAGFFFSFVNKILLEHSHATCLLIVYVCFHTTAAELNSCSRDLWLVKPNIFTVWSFTKNHGFYTTKTSPP